MTASSDLERRLNAFYSDEAPRRAPDWVLRSTLATIDSTPQRRTAGRSAWSRQRARRVAWLAIAAALAVSAGGIGLALSQLNRAPDDTASPTPTPTTTLAAEFQHPFTHVLPTSISSSGTKLAVGANGSTSWEFLVPGSEGLGSAAVGGCGSCDQRRPGRRSCPPEVPYGDLRH